MNKSLITYGVTIAVTVLTFTVLAQQDKLSTRNNDHKNKYSNEYTNEHKNEHYNSDSHTDEGAGISLQQAIDSVLTKRGGNIIKAETEREYGKKLYEIKGVDADGNRYKLYLNAANGQTLKSSYND